MGRLFPGFRPRFRQPNGLGSISVPAIDCPNEAIPSPRYGFKELRALCIVIQRRPKPRHGVVEALLEIHKRVSWPQLLLQFFPCDGLAGTLKQHDEDVYRLPLQPDLHPLFAEFSSSRIKLEHAKTEGWRQGTGGLHDDSPRTWIVAPSCPPPTSTSACYLVP